MSDVLRAISFDDIKAWRDHDFNGALHAFQRSAQEIITSAAGFKRPVRFGGKREDWLPACRESLTTKDPAGFFNTAFLPFQVIDTDRPQGLFTGYFEPEANGSLVATDEFKVPVYRKPQDLVAFTTDEQLLCKLAYGRRTSTGPAPYFTRQQIEQGALQNLDLEICWLKHWADAFFMQIQGSGRVSLPDGRVLRLSYGAKSGHPYQSIGAVLVERGIFTPETVSMQSLRRWMAQHPEASRALMWQNKSFVFFQTIIVDDPGLGAVGAGKVNLTPLRSLAVDRSHWAFGTPVWLDTTTPAEAPDGIQPLQRLMIAQDTGSAIKGLVRGDVYWGWGKTAALIAGHMKSAGRMTVLLPKPLALRMSGGA